MSSIRPSFSKHSDGDECSYWGCSFRWTSLHQSPAQLHPLVYKYDNLADDCLHRLNELSPKDPPQNIDQESKPVKGKPRDLWALLKDHADDDPKLKQLWTEVNTVPSWVDWDQIKRGQEVFYRYGLPILNVLNFESLLGGMGSSRVVETLARTGGFSTFVARRRMFETLQYILQVMTSIESIKPGGDGHASSVRVRLLHAAVRQRILALAREQPDYFDVEKLGVPVNELDCIGTINTFSTSVIWLGLPRQGIYLRSQEIDDYIALWRLVAYYMGTPTEPFESSPKARAIMESLLASEIAPTEMGKVLAANIILSLENTAPSYASKEFMEAMARQLNGKQLSDSLGIPEPGLYYQALVYGYCFFVMGLAYTIRYFPSLDRDSIAVCYLTEYQALLTCQIRRRRYHNIVANEKTGLGGETLFEFKHIPKLTRTTRLGKRRVSKAERPGIETLARMGLLIAGGAVVVLSSPIVLWLWYRR